jgi:hypothetical protein
MNRNTVIYIFICLYLSCGGTKVTDKNKDISETQMDTAKDAVQENLAENISDQNEVLEEMNADEYSSADEETAENEPDVPVSVDTVVEKKELKAGDSILIQCVVTGGNYETEVEIDKMDGIEIVGDFTKFTKPGEYTATCTIPSLSIKDETPEIIKVSHGDPVKLELFTEPAKILLNEPAEVNARIFDSCDNEITDMEIEPAALDPSDGFTAVPDAKNKFIFSKEGKWKISSNVTGYPDVKASINIMVDVTPPLIIISQPVRGIELTGNKIIEVKGSVKEEVAGLKTFTVNGKETSLDASGNFTFTIDSAQGLNIIKAVAVDNAENKAKKVQSYYFSNKYYEFIDDKPESALVPEAIMIYLAKEFFDDGVHDKTHPDDLSTIIIVVLSGLNIGEMIPNPVATQKLIITTYTIYITSITFDKDKMDASLLPIEGGMHLSATLPNFNAAVEIHKDPCLLCNPPKVYVKGNIVAESVSISSDIMISLGSDKKLDAEAKNTKVELKNLKWQSDTQLEQIFFDWFINWMIDVFKKTIEDEIKKQIEDQIPKMLEDALNQMAFNQSFDIKPFIGKGDPIKLKLTSEITDAEFHEEGALLGMKGSITTGKIIKPENLPLGSIGRADCLSGTPEVFSFPKEYEMEIAAHDDFVNEAVYSIWWGNMLTLHVTAADLGDTDLTQYGIENLMVDTNFYLPPMMTSCSSEGKLIAQIGDMWVHATFDLLGTPTEFEFFASLEAEVSVTVADGEQGKEVGFKIGDPKTFEVEFLKVSDNFKGNEDALESLLKDMLIGQLLKQLGEKAVSFPIPEIDLSEIDDSIPPGTKLSIAIEKVKKVLGYTLVQGELK